MKKHEVHPGDLPDPGIKPTSPELQADSLLLSYQGSLFFGIMGNIYILGLLWWLRG